MAPAFAKESFLSEIRRRVRPLLHGAGIDPTSVDWSLESDGPRLIVRCEGAVIDPRSRQAITVRVLEAVGALERTVGDVAVSFLTGGAGAEAEEG